MKADLWSHSSPRLGSSYSSLAAIDRGSSLCLAVVPDGGCAGRSFLPYFPRACGDGVGRARLLLRACQGAKALRPMGSTCGVRLKAGQTVLRYSVIASCLGTTTGLW